MSEKFEAITKLLWCDLEMTGLEPEQDTIIEVACMVTDLNFEIVDEGFEMALYCPEERLLKMDKWNRKHHRESNLWERCLKSSTTMEEAEAACLAITKKHFKKNKGVLAGNSIWQDRRFIRKYMPKWDEYLNYRMFDVSSFKVLFEGWMGQEKLFEKKNAHRAKDDIVETIEEMKFYREGFLKVPNLN